MCVYYTHQGKPNLKVNAGKKNNIPSFLDGFWSCNTIFEEAGPALYLPFLFSLIIMQKKHFSALKSTFTSLALRT